MDALIDRESLVSAEIFEEDLEKYRWMLEYGFRPTRRFNKDGSALMKMDLKTLRSTVRARTRMMKNPFLNIP